MITRVLLVICITLSNSSWASDTLVIGDDFDYVVLGSEISVYHDPTGALGPEDLSEVNFSKLSEKRPNLGFKKGAVWLRSLITNQGDEDQFRIQLHQPVLDTVEAFIRDENGHLLQHTIYGEAFPFAQRKYEVPYFIWDLNIPKGQTKTVYFRLATQEQIVLPVYVASIEGSRSIAQKTNLLFGAYFGLILVMAFYNLFIYFTVRDRSYLLYVIYILAVGSTQAVLEGYFHQYLWPDNSWFAMRSVYFFTALVSTSSIVFLRNFLKTKTFAPEIDKIANFIYLYFGVIVLTTALFGISQFVHMGSQIGITVVSFYILTTAIVVYRNGYAPAKFFIIAWAVLVVGIIIYALKDAGLLPSTPLTNYMMQAGSALEALLLSLALADRINILKKEKSKSQEEALRISLENERIVKEQNIILEQKVDERTKDLKGANAKLSEAIEELKETQSQLVQAEKMASLGQLTAGVAHEINNPINFVSANIEPLRYDVNDILDVLNLYDDITNSDEFETKKEAIEKFKREIDLNYTKNELTELLAGIEEGAKRTAEIVSGLKTFSRIDESSLKEINLNEGIRSTLDILQNAIPTKVNIDLDLDENIPEVECFGGKVNQVMMNIMNNAIQAMEKNPPEKPPKLIVRTGSENGNVWIEISDNGMGMSDEIKDRIFEPFYTTKEVGKGTGLGLSIAFKIIETHGGTIDVESKLNKGTTFKVKLPIKAQIESEIIA